MRTVSRNEARCHVSEQEPFPPLTLTPSPRWVPPAPASAALPGAEPSCRRLRDQRCPRGQSPALPLSSRWFWSPPVLQKGIGVRMEEESGLKAYGQINALSLPPSYTCVPSLPMPLASLAPLEWWIKSSELCNEPHCLSQF